MKLKCVFLGDRKVGKTWLITTFITRENPSGHLPTIFDSFSAKFEIKKKQVELNLWDTASDLEYDRVRQLSYPNTDVFFICYAINSIRSFDNVKNWYNEIKNISEANKIPIILVATKDDTRNDQSQQDIITTEMGISLQKEFNFSDFVETSSLERKNLYTLFEKAVELKIRRNKSFHRRFLEVLCFCCV